MSEEEKRGISEQLTEEELVIFDLLTKPEIKLTKAEEQQVKKVAKELLETLKREKLVLDWRKAADDSGSSSSRLRPCWMNFRGCTRLSFTSRSASVYQHFFDSYSGRDNIA